MKKHYSQQQNTIENKNEGNTSTMYQILNTGIV